MDISIQNDRKIEKVEYIAQEDSRYKSANSNHVVVIDTILGRVYINSNSHFKDVPESAWNAAFSGELSPKQFLEEKIGTELTDYHNENDTDLQPDDTKELQAQYEIIDAFKSINNLPHEILQ